MKKKHVIFAVSVLIVVGLVAFKTSKSSPRECLQDFKGCPARGATQVTYNVRSNGEYDFKVAYYGNNPGPCYKSGHAPSGTGMVNHEEYTVSQDGSCMELINRSWFK